LKQNNKRGTKKFSDRSTSDSKKLQCGVKKGYEKTKINEQHGDQLKFLLKA
jgi:hypothetical protein